MAERDFYSELIEMRMVREELMARFAEIRQERKAILERWLQSCSYR